MKRVKLRIRICDPYDVCLALGTFEEEKRWRKWSGNCGVDDKISS